MKQLPEALASMGQYRQFIGYRLEADPSKPGKTHKKPVDIATGWTHNPHDPAIWQPFEAVAAALQPGRVDGVGFVFTATDPFWFLDIDNCLTNAGWSALATELVQATAGAAVEVSQSGTGLHIIGSGVVPPHGCKNTALGLELYHTERFVALTGTGATGSAAHDASAALPGLVAKYFPPAVAGEVAGDGPCPEWDGHTDDAELLQHAYNTVSAAARFGDRATFKQLFEGDADALAKCFPDGGGRPYDESSADMALAQHLAFWTGRDGPRIERLMRLSGLQRDKWDRPDYLPRTIETACSRTTEVHKRKRVERPESDVTEVISLETERNEHPDLSHDRLARGLSTRGGFSKTARYVALWGAWMFYEGNRWQRDTKLRAMTRTRNFLRAESEALIAEAKRRARDLTGADAGKVMRWARDNAKQLMQSSTVNAVESMARSNEDLAAAPEQFDAEPLLLGTPDGAVDLRSGELLPPSPDHWLTRTCAVSPAPSGTDAPLWRAFLDRVLGPEVAAFVQRAAGYALTGRTDEHKLFFLYGTGRNGKSVFLNTLFAILGDYAKRAPAQTFLDSAGERHPTDLAGLMGARLVAGSELPPGKAWNESVIKDLTGGDVITARFMRQDYFEYQPQFTLFIAGNHQPAFRGIDEAIRARVVLIPFTQTIPADERDPLLPEKLKAEWPAILRWAIEGALLWQREGLQVPDVVRCASEEYLADEDTLGAFLDENVIMAPDGRETSADVYQRFRAWQTQTGAAHLWTQTAMTRALKERGIPTAKFTGGARGFRGIRLKSPFLRESGT